MACSVFTESLHNPSKDLQLYGKKKIILLRPKLSLPHIWKKRSWNHLQIQISFLSKGKKIIHCISNCQACSIARGSFQGNTGRKGRKIHLIKWKSHLFASMPGAYQNNPRSPALIPVAISHSPSRDFTDEPAAAPWLNCAMFDGSVKKPWSPPTTT